MIDSIRLKDIRKKYPLADFTLHIDDLELKNHHIHAIVGSNGSGKTTLLKLISLLDKPQEGRILFNNRNVFPRRNGHERLRQNIGFLTQTPYLFNLDVFENIALGLRIRKYPRNEIVSKVNDVLETLNIRHLAGRRPRHLSRGEYQKVAIAQVIVLEPEVILMDEPAANIDTQSILSIEGAIRAIQKKINSMIIMTTHSLTQANRVSPDIISIKEGRVVDFVHGLEAIA